MQNQINCPKMFNFLRFLKIIAIKAYRVFIFFPTVHDRLAASFSNRQVNVYSGEGDGLITTANLRPHETALTGMAFRYTLGFMN
jgi:hypothetical protein